MRALRARIMFLAALTTLPVMLATKYYIPQSYDQRLYGLQTYAFQQKSCGSCWAATVANAAETGLLRARKQLNLTDSTDTMRVSTQWILEHSLSNDGCGGGDFYWGVLDVYELGGDFPREGDVPYKGGYVEMQPDAARGHESAERTYRRRFEASKDSQRGFLVHHGEISWKALEHANATQIETDFLRAGVRRLPIELLRAYAAAKFAADAGEVANVFSDIYEVYDNYNEPLRANSSEVETAKYLISRGIPVVTAMSLSSVPWLRKQFLSNWNGDLMTGACSREIDHQVVIVGYGKFKGKDCWLIKNSWGSGFGQFGYFYVEIGADTLCTERSMYAALPAGFSFSEPVFGVESAEDNQLAFVYAKLVKPGRASFDNDDGTYSDWRQVGYLTVVEGALYVFCTALLLGVAVGIRKRIKDHEWRR